MPQKLRDLAVKTGEYQDRQPGQMKGRWQNIGALMKGDDGNEFIILHRWFNPAGIPNPENRDSLLVSCFRPQQQGQQGGGAPPQQGGYQQQPQNPPQQSQQGANGPGFNDFDDEIPFARAHYLMGG